jgi:hypothetical protein
MITDNTSNAHPEHTGRPSHVHAVMRLVIFIFVAMVMSSLVMKATLTGD